MAQVPETQLPEQQSVSAVQDLPASARYFFSSNSIWQDWVPAQSRSLLQVSPTLAVDLPRVCLSQMPLLTSHLPATEQRPAVPEEVSAVQVSPVPVHFLVVSLVSQGLPLLTVQPVVAVQPLEKRQTAVEN